MSWKAQKLRPIEEQCTHRHCYLKACKPDPVLLSAPDTLCMYSLYRTFTGGKELTNNTMYDIKKHTI
jgi:hypothetical protein